MAYFSQEMKKELAPVVKKILKQYGLKGSLSVHHHSSFVLNITAGPIDFIKNYYETNKDRPNWCENLTADSLPNHIQVNNYHIDSSYSGKAKEVLLKIKNAMMKGNHDNSDMMTDYHDVGWYVDINIGRWDKPYQVW